MVNQFRSCDAPVVWKFDRLAGSRADLATILEQLCAKGAKFQSLIESTDASGPVSRMLMPMLGSLGEFERR